MALAVHSRDSGDLRRVRARQSAPRRRRVYQRHIGNPGGRMGIAAAPKSSRSAEATSNAAGVFRAPAMRKTWSRFSGPGPQVAAPVPRSGSSLRRAGARPQQQPPSNTHTHTPTGLTIAMAPAVHSRDWGDLRRSRARVARPPHLLALPDVSVGFLGQSCCNLHEHAVRATGLAR